MFQRVNIVENSEFSFFHFLCDIRQTLQIFVSLAKDFIIRIDMNIHRQRGVFKDRTAALRFERALHGQQRSSITTTFQ